MTTLSLSVLREKFQFLDLTKEIAVKHGLIVDVYEYCGCYNVYILKEKLIFCSSKLRTLIKCNEVVFVSE